MSAAQRIADVNAGGEHAEKLTAEHGESLPVLEKAVTESTVVAKHGFVEQLWLGSGGEKSAVERADVERSQATTPKKCRSNGGLEGKTPDATRKPCSQAVKSAAQKSCMPNAGRAVAGKLWLGGCRCLREVQ